VNLKQLAHHLGLSQTTVSRALNGFPEVGESTRRRVIEAAERFHYRPNASARTLATGRAGAIGLVMSPERDFLLDPIFADFLAGIAERSAAEDRDVLVSSTRGDEAGAYRRLARMRLVDAVILSTPLVEDPRPSLLQRLGLPAVLHGRTGRAAPLAFVDIDNEGGFSGATRSLAELGHRRIGLVNGDTRYTFAADRLRGWRKALAACGLSAADDLQTSAPMSEESGYRCASRLLGQPDPPTALLCSSIFLALGAMRAVRDRGLSIGSDISLIAHDDGIAAIRPETLTPPLSTTHSPIRAAGRRVAEIASALAEGAPPHLFREVWPVDLIRRQSAQAPRTR
jgi:LacI family transcriptional regulator